MVSGGSGSRHCSPRGLRDRGFQPVGDFPALRLPAHSTLQIADFGGHCGFIEGAGLRGYAERWVADRLEAAVAEAARATMPAPASA